MDISIILPVWNEVGNLEKLFGEILENTNKITQSYEVIFVDDGSNDGSDGIINKLYLSHRSKVKYIALVQHYGKSAALDAGFKLAQGNIVFTMDSDGQDDPKEMSKFVQKIKDGYDLVSGWKQYRQDSFIKNNTSKIYNWAVNLVFGLNLHDNNCGFKAYKNVVVKNLILYSRMHRFIPVFVSNMGFKIGEVKIEHRKRFSGKTKYGSKRFIDGFLDLLKVIYLINFASKPLPKKVFYEIEQTYLWIS